MKNKYLLIIIFSILFGCKQNINEKIIYTVSENATKKIIEAYHKEQQESPNDIYYLTIEVNDLIFTEDESYIFSLNHCEKEMYCSSAQKFANKTNRYLKLNNEVLIPIAIISDMYFVRDDSRELPSQVGGDKNFIINTKGELIEMFHGM